MIKHWMERKWLDYVICLTVPLFALIIGLLFMAKGETKEHNLFGLRLVKLSLIVMILSALAYYIIFTPMFGLD